MKRIVSAILTTLMLAGGTLAAPTIAAPLPEPETINPGDIDTYATLGIMRFLPDHNTIGDLSPGLRIGLPGAFDMGLTAPYRYDFEQRQGALRHLQGSLGYGVTTSVGLYGAFRGYTTLQPTEEEQGVGTGRHNFGVRTDWAADQWVDAGTLHFGVALERKDVLHTVDKNGDETGLYRLATRMTWEGGLEMDMDTRATPYLGIRIAHGVGYSRHGTQDSLALRPGVRIPLGNPHMELQLMGHLALVRNDAEPEVAVFASLIYRHRPPPPPDFHALARQVGHTQLQVDDLDHRVRDIEVRIAEDPDQYAREPEGVHVLNHSGIPDLESKVAEMLEEAGFPIGHTADEPEVHRRHRTLVEYAPGEADLGRRIARSLPGFQMAEPNEDLPRGVKARVLVGFDLE